MMSAIEHLAGMRILFLNWRDSSHPQAGGAEAYCHEIARRWAAADVEVTIFASRFPRATAYDRLDGVAIRRAGGVFGVYPAAVYHVRRNRREYDAVVDFQNGIPFFSPLGAGRWLPTICVIHHVHQDQFDDRFGWPLNVTGRVLEKQVSRMVYRGRPVVAVSLSTREEVRRRLRFTNPLYLVPNGAPPCAPECAPRSARPTIAVVNRLVPHKRVDLLLQAVPNLLVRWPDLHVDIVGDGGEFARLAEMPTQLGTSAAVDFHGYVSEERKRELLARAWLMVVPSRAEGWGLTVIEANSVGTPALAFDVPGLRDAIQHDHNGWLLRPGSDLADGIDRALNTLSAPDVSAPMADRCMAWAKQFSWDDSALRLAEVVVAELRRVQRRRRSRRRSSDLAVLARFTANDADALERVTRVSMRRTDVFMRRGNSFEVLMHGCDEFSALKTLRRVGVDRATVRLASRWDVVHTPERILG